MQLYTLFLNILLFPLTLTFNLQILQPDVTQPIVFSNGKLTTYYNASIYDQHFACTNGQLQIIQFQQSPDDQLIVFRFSGAELLQTDINITVQPNLQPKPFIRSFNRINKKFVIDAGCPDIITRQNYYNRVKVTLRVEYSFLRKLGHKNYFRQPYQKNYQFNFLLNCDLWDVHKHFQYGYIFISLICITIVFFVSHNPRICSLVINQKPLNFQIKWKWLLLMMIFLFGVLWLIYQRELKSPNDLKQYFSNRIDKQQKFHMANLLLKHVGLLFSLIYVYVCCSQFFFQYSYLLDTIPLISHVKIKKIISRRVLASAFISVISYIIGIWYDNWIYYNLLSSCIAIGAIKMFRFKSLRDGFYTLIVVVISITVFTIWSYSKLARPITDYSSQLSSPLFIEVPDLVNNLYKKCSWVSIYDMILPGAILAYLRDYDQNYHVGWKGVYTFTSIATFSLSCLSWVVIQALSQYSVPFCIVIYPPFVLSVVFLSLYRNQFQTIWYGHFHYSMDLTIVQIIHQYNKKSSNNEPPINHIFPKQLLQAIKLQQQKWSQSRSIGSYRKIIDEPQLQFFNTSLIKGGSFSQYHQKIINYQRQFKSQQSSKTDLLANQKIIPNYKKIKQKQTDLQFNKKVSV